MAGLPTYDCTDYDDVLGVAGARLVQEALHDAVMQRHIIEPNRTLHDTSSDAQTFAFKATLEAGAWPLGLGLNYLPAAGAPVPFPAVLSDVQAALSYTALAARVWVNRNNPPT